MCAFMDDYSRLLLGEIEYLLSQGTGNVPRLEHIKKSIIENKTLYNSDIQYVQALSNKRSHDSQKQNVESNVTCWKCSEHLLENSRYCSFCGVAQNRKEPEFEQVISKRMRQGYGLLSKVFSLNLYQILAVVGGIASLVPIIAVESNLEGILQSIEFYTDGNLSGIVPVLAGMGIVSGILSCLSMITPFIIKKPRQAGKILFFSSFGILGFSIFVGAIGFVAILIASILAMKRRY